MRPETSLFALLPKHCLRRGATEAIHYHFQERHAIRQKSKWTRVCGRTIATVVQRTQPERPSARSREPRYASVLGNKISIPLPAFSKSSDYQKVDHLAPCLPSTSRRLIAFPQTLTTILSDLSTSSQNDHACLRFL
jgi:hypothetical protein